MIVSKKRRAAIYAAIRKPIIDLRVALLTAPVSGNELDAALAQIELKIWNRVRSALEMEADR